MTDGVFEQTENGVTFNVHLVPGAKKEGFLGIIDGPDGSKQVKVAICARPVEGQANEALIKFLAARFRIARSNAIIVSGMRSRNKKILLRGYRVCNVPPEAY
jgi:uncharacterized protein (TIGR00251 family)